MKRSLKLLIVCCCLALCAALFAVSALAVPAAPGSGREGQEAACRSHHGELVKLYDIPAARRSLLSNKAFVPALGHVKKDIPMVAIVVGFNNIGYSNDYDWNKTFFSDDKSITAYYSDMSFGQFTFLPAAETSAYNVDGNTNTADKADDGVIHIALDVRHEDWATDYARTKPDKDREQYLQLVNIFKAAIEKADDSLDFAAFDADGNGTIENTELAISFVVAGYEGSYLEDYTTVGIDKVLWSHAYSIMDIISDYEFELDPPTPDGVTVGEYIAVAEELEPGLPQPISTLAHELGHYLGLPDLYDTEYNYDGHWGQYDVATASVMCSAWGDDPETGSYVPFSMDPWCRYKLGWIDPVVAKTTGDYNVTGQSYTENDAYTVVMIPTQKEQEYYLLENRQLTKWDAGMTTTYAGASRIGGVILWHIDDAVFDEYNEYNMVNNAFHRPAIMPLFPEMNRKGDTVFTGVGDVFSNNPFYDRTYAIDVLELKNATINLPLYGTGGMADQRLGRWESGIKVEFLDDSAPEMQVRIDLNEEKPLNGGEDQCMLCHRVHTGFFGKIIGYIHQLLYILKGLFNR